MLSRGAPESWGIILGPLIGLNKYIKGVTNLGMGEGHRHRTVCPGASAMAR